MRRQSLFLLTGAFLLVAGNLPSIAIGEDLPKAPTPAIKSDSPTPNASQWPLITVIPGVPEVKTFDAKNEKKEVFAADLAVVILFYDSKDDTGMFVARQQMLRDGLQSLNYPDVWFRRLDVQDEAGYGRALFQKLVTQNPKFKDEVKEEKERARVPRKILMVKAKDTGRWGFYVCPDVDPTPIAMTDWIARCLKAEGHCIKPKVRTLNEEQEVTAKNCKERASDKEKTPVYTMFYEGRRSDVRELAEDQKGELALASLAYPNVRFRWVNVSNSAEEQTLFENMVPAERRTRVCHALAWPQQGGKWEVAIAPIPALTAGMSVSFLNGKLAPASLGTTVVSQTDGGIKK